MKKLSILSTICVIALAQIVSAQLHTESSSEDLRLGRPHPNPIGDPTGQAHTQHISFDDGVGPGNAGTYSPTDHFGVDLYVTFNGYNSTGYDIWLETTADAAPHISLTNFVWAGSPFDKPIQPVSFPLGFTLLGSNGLYTTPNPSDLGNGVSVVDAAHVVPPGTYLAGHLSVSLTGFAPGTYVLQTSSLNPPGMGINPHASQVTSFDGTNFLDNYLPTATYTITIVPEPSTFALLVVTVIGAGATFCRRAIRRNPDVTSNCRS